MSSGKLKIIIIIISGKNPILLITSHGHPKNDEKTNKITTLLAERLDCYAVINEYYSRQRKTRNNKSGKLEERPHNLKIGKAKRKILGTKRTKIIEFNPSSWR